MAAFDWKKEYNLNIEEIDKQHKKLMEIGKRAYDIAIIDDGYDEIMTIIDELLEYTKYHYKYEENMLKGYNYNHKYIKVDLKIVFNQLFYDKKY